MDQVVSCPVCGTEIVRTYYSGDYGPEEDHSSCDNCGFFSHMAYGPTMDGIFINYGPMKDRLRRLHIVLKHHKKIKSMNLKINPDYAKYL